MLEFDCDIVCIAFLQGYIQISNMYQKFYIQYIQNVFIPTKPLDLIEKIYQIYKIILTWTILKIFQIKDYIYFFYCYKNSKSLSQMLDKIENFKNLI